MDGKNASSGVGFEGSYAPISLRPHYTYSTNYIHHPIVHQMGLDEIFRNDSLCRYCIVLCNPNPLNAAMGEL